MLEIVYHWDIHRILVLVLLLRLFKGLILKIEPVFTKLVVVVFGNTIQPLMDKHRTHNARQCIENAVCGKTSHLSTPDAAMQYYTENR